MDGEHIFKPFDKDLLELKTKLMKMGRKAEKQLERAVEALVKRDESLAEKIISKDDKIDSLQSEIDDLTVEILATRQPMAFDLRVIISGLKMAGDLERIADYAANIAGYVRELNSESLTEPLDSISRMADIALGMLRDVLFGIRGNRFGKSD